MTSILNKYSIITNRYSYYKSLYRTAVNLLLGGKNISWKVINWSKSQHIGSTKYLWKLYILRTNTSKLKSKPLLSTVFSKKMKYFSIILTKYVQHLYPENYKMLWKKINKDLDLVTLFSWIEKYAKDFNFPKWIYIFNAMLTTILFFLSFFFSFLFFFFLVELDKLIWKCILKSKKLK